MHPVKKIPVRMKYYVSQWIGKIFGKRFFWDLEALFKPKDAILSGCKNEEDFFRQGEKDVEYLEKLNLVNKETVSLHLGCGIGRMERFLAPKVKEAYGIDISKVMIKKAQKMVQFPNVHFFDTNGKDLKLFKDQTFTLIYSFFVFQHLSRTVVMGYMQEAARVLRINGYFLCQFQYRGEDEIVEDPDESHPWGIRLYNIQDVTALGDEANLTIKEIYNLEEAQLLRSQGAEHGECNVWVLYQKV